MCDVPVSASETQTILEEALELRRKRQALMARKTEPDLKLAQPISLFTYVSAQCQLITVEIQGFDKKPG